MTNYYLYKIQTVRVEMLTVGPTEMEVEVTTAHFNYLKDLCDKGIVMLAGRTTNDDATALGLNVFRAEDDAAARDLVVNDPAMQQRVMRAEWYPFGPPTVKKDNLDGRPQWLWVVRPVRPEMLSEGSTDDETKHAAAHGEYLLQLIDKGIVVLFGRTKNTDYTSMGIIILQAETEAEARAIIAQDPAVKNRIFRAELYPYRIALFGDVD